MFVRPVSRTSPNRVISRDGRAGDACVPRMVLRFGYGRGDGRIAVTVFPEDKVTSEWSRVLLADRRA
jgi:hypothetical protein